ncbi:MFS transporter [Anabaena cylindrica UHCC 0172]|uniref:MFS transporter n=1 Tax=Anabaena cylindrica TaxID=1165 RepID=UPI002B21BA30|nr:MFS transporter [Anabaena cylindrica]MEA5552705.1 MFS transporter [Anabaena cylindrica UHCC 0172]
MRTFMIIWCGQIVSAIGSAMTRFALTIWVWQLTGEATSIALFSFFYQLPLIFVSLFAGVLVDRYRRKYLIILGDTSAILCTIIIGLLCANNNLQIWHLYFLIALSGCFGHLQNLAYSASIPLIVAKQHYTRASSMSALVVHASEIFAPAFAGSLYPSIGLLGIIVIDIATFAIATGTVIFLSIPQPAITETSNKEGKTIWEQLGFGFRYILSKPSLLSMTIAFSCFWFAHQIAETIFQPMILARTGGDTEILGIIMTAAGVGGVVSGSFLSIWGGFKRRIHGMLLGFIGTGLSKIVFGIAQIPFIWVGTSFCSAFNLPLLFSSSNAIWYAKVEPNVQGRIFAADHTMGMIIGTVASLIAGPLADKFFEPAMKPGGLLSSTLSPIFGTETGSGMALLYVITSLCVVSVGIGGYFFPKLRNVEDILPDHHAK